MTASEREQLRVELVRLYRFSLDGRVLCAFPAEKSWFQIQQDVEEELQKQGMPATAARKVWERLRASE